MKRLLLIGLLLFCGSKLCFSQGIDPSGQGIEERINRLEKNVGNNAERGLVLTLFGAVCALWAQNTGRNAWLWFFLGMIFSFITVFVLLWKNAEDIERRRANRAS